MQRRQSRRTSTDLVDLAVEVVHTAIDVRDIRSIRSHLAVERRDVLTSRVGRFHVRAILLDARLVVDRACIDGILRTLIDRRIGHILDGRVFPQRNGLAVVTVIVDGVLGRSLQLIFRSGLTGRNLSGVPSLVLEAIDCALIVTSPIEVISLTERFFVLVVSDVTTFAVMLFILRSFAISTVYVIGPSATSFSVTLTLLEPASTLTDFFAILLMTVLPASVMLDKFVSAFVFCNVSIFLLFVSIRPEFFSIASPFFSIFCALV